MNALGYDPVPGDPDEVRRIAKVLGGIADNAELANRNLSRVATGRADAVWKGAAAEAFQHTLGTLSADLTKVRQSYHDAWQALDAYAAALAAAQDHARKAVRDADSAVADRDSARRRAGVARELANHHDGTARAAAARKLLAEAALLQSQATGDAAGVSTHRIEIGTQDRIARQATSAQQEAARHEREANADAAAAGERFEDARRLAADAADDRDAAANQAIRQLHSAGDEGIQPRSFLQNLHDIAVDVVTSPAFDEFLDILSTGADVLLALAPVAIAACAIGGLLLGGPAGLAAGLAMGVTASRVMTAAGMSLKAAVVLGRAAQTAADPSKADRLVTAGADLAASVLLAKFFRGNIKGKPLVQGGPLVSGLRDVKRVLAFDKNTTLSGLPRKALWSAVKVAPKMSPAFGVSGRTLQAGRAALELTAAGTQTGDSIIKTVDLLTEPSTADDPIATREKLIEAEDAAIDRLGEEIGKVK